jgi:DNA-directed RNA polymerase specialized sigma24 family protein
LSLIKLSHKERAVIPEDQFEALLRWLSPDRETAGQKYEVIRSGLIRIFMSHGFNDAEDLADLTISRVTNKMPALAEEYVGDPSLYFFGVARNVVREARRRKEVATDQLPEHFTIAAVTTEKYDCLLKCLQVLNVEKREFILDYYLYAGRDKIEHHKRMAEELSITEGALRTRAHHIRIALQKCVSECIAALLEKQKSSLSTLSKRR